MAVLRKYGNINGVAKITIKKKSVSKNLQVILKLLELLV
jgi:hypothetical protein